MSRLTLTPEQRRIITHAGSTLLIHAVAGSGKTTTLAHCIAQAERQGMPADAILALVFSDTARDVFLQRLKTAAASRHVQVMTYRQFADSLLAHWSAHSLINPVEQPQAESDALRPILFDAIEQTAGLPGSDPDYSFDCTNLHAEILLRQSNKLKGTLQLRDFDDLSDAELADWLDLPRGLIAVLRRIERARKPELDDIRFQWGMDSVHDVLELLRHWSDLLPLPAYRLIVADEWHDASACHLELLQRLRRAETRLIAAGDREQVVHSQSGADPRLMGERFLQAYPDTQTPTLSTSFRCGPMLSACAEALSGQRFLSSSDNLGQVSYASYSTQAPDACAQLLVRKLLSPDLLPEAGLQAAAVLLRSPHQSIAIENALIEHDLPYRCAGLQSYFERREILMLRGMLHIVLGRMSPVTDRDEIRGMLRALGDYAGLQHTEQDWLSVERFIREDPTIIQTFYTGWLARIDPSHSLTPARRRWRHQFKQTCDTLIEQAQDWSAGQVLETAARELDLARITRRLLVHQDDARAVEDTIRGFIHSAVQSELGIEAFLQQLATQRQRSLQAGRREQALTLATCHEAKGKEWDTVIVPNLAPGEFPRSHQDPAEERRLFYVALTRAKQHFLVLTPLGTTHPYLQAMNLDAARQAERVQVINDRPDRIYLEVPYADKEQVKSLGAQWDYVQRKWWITRAMPKRSFSKWMAEAPKDGA